MFLGEYHTKFTGKGRVILPSKMREELAGKVLVLSRGFEGCIWGFDEKLWQEEAKRQLLVPATEERGRFLRRYLFSGSESVELDSQGRFVIPSALLDYASVKEDVVIIGTGDHFEVWDKKAWKKHLKDIEREYGRISQTRSSEGSN